MHQSITTICDPVFVVKGCENWWNGREECKFSMWIRVWARGRFPNMWISSKEGWLVSSIMFFLRDHRCKSKGKKVKLSLCLTKHHAMKTYWGSGGLTSHILDLGTRWRWVVSFTPRPLYPQGKSPWYPLDRRLGGPQSRSGHGGEEKNSQPPPGIEP
jgi:hypothetical protein